MSRRRDRTRAEVDRRQFMVGASALGAAGLAASLGRPDLAEGAAQPAAPTGAKPRKPRREEFTIHQDAPTITPLDVGDPGRSVGDSFSFHADLRPAPGDPVVGQVFGVKNVVKTSTPDNPGVEQRITQLFFTFDNRQDLIVVAGVPDYPVQGVEFDADRPVVRTVVGGTGAFIGARGQLTSTRHPEGGYTQVFTLLK